MLFAAQRAARACSSRKEWASGVFDPRGPQPILIDSVELRELGEGLARHGAAVGPPEPSSKVALVERC